MLDEKTSRIGKKAARAETQTAVFYPALEFSARESGTDEWGNDGRRAQPAPQRYGLAQFLGCA